MGSILLSIDTVSKMKMHPVQVWQNFPYTASNVSWMWLLTSTIDNVSWMWLLRHNRVRAKRSALHCYINAHYATSSAQSVLRIRVIDERGVQYGLILHSSSVQWNMAKVAKFPGRRGNMFFIEYGRNHTKDKRASKIHVFILPLKCLIWNNNRWLLDESCLLYVWNKLCNVHL